MERVALRVQDALLFFLGRDDVVRFYVPGEPGACLFRHGADGSQLPPFCLCSRELVRRNVTLRLAEENAEGFGKQLQMSSQRRRASEKCCPQPRACW